MSSRDEQNRINYKATPLVVRHKTTSTQGCIHLFNLSKEQNKTRKIWTLTRERSRSSALAKLCVDLIGPYTINRKGQKNLICKACTMIDRATGWFEIHQIPDKSSITVSNIVEQEWLSRYPWPEMVTTDRGSEFIGHDFRDMMTRDYGVKEKPITVRNPQANAILERIHQVIGNIIHTFELQENYLDEDDPWKGILSATAFAVRATYHTTLQKTPGQLVFGRDMIFNIKHVANWELIKKRKQKRIRENNIQENKKRKPYNYRVGEKVMLKKGSENKYETPYIGPYVIQQINNNGTVRLQKGAVSDTYNIRQLHPFKE